MTDIVDRLRKSQLHIPGNIVAEAADEIERLREALQKTYCDCELKKEISWHEEENIRLREALRRLATLNEFVNGEPTSVEEVMNYTQYVARSALEGKE